ncbi:MAG: hypothetical protein ACLFVO_25510, partial [Chloroflexaceae bacterium]
DAGTGTYLGVAFTGVTTLGSLQAGGVIRNAALRGQVWLTSGSRLARGSGWSAWGSMPPMKARCGCGPCGVTAWRLASGPRCNSLARRMGCFRLVMCWRRGCWLRVEAALMLSS